MSRKKTQIEIKAGYIIIGKQFVGFNFRQKKISSTAVMLAVDNYSQNLYTNLSSIFGYFSRKRLYVSPLWLIKPKWNNHTQFLLKSSENNTSSDDLRETEIDHLTLSSLTIRSKTWISFLSLVNIMGLTKMFSPRLIYKTNIYKNRTRYTIYLICKY